VIHAVCNYVDAVNFSAIIDERGGAHHEVDIGLFPAVRDQSRRIERQDRLVPHDSAGRQIERDRAGIVGRLEHAAIGNCHAAVARDGRQSAPRRMAIAPNQHSSTSRSPTHTSRLSKTSISSSVEQRAGSDHILLFHEFDAALATMATDERIAKAVRTRPVPSFDEIRMALAAMPTGTKDHRYSGKTPPRIPLSEI
jgi:hypothetical protein